SELDRADEEAQQHCPERETEPRDHGASVESHTLRIRAEREEEGEGAAGEQHVLQELRMRAEYAEADREGETAPRPSTPIAHPADDEPQGQREERAHVQ